jgi:phenylpropionate dioxygenase-like ring-hydroxylating dioxygenase large terminal subunit
MGFTAYAAELSSQCMIVPGFAVTMNVDPRLVVENAFDEAHFQPVHGVLNRPSFAILPESGSGFAVAGRFALPSSPWHRVDSETLEVDFVARAFSPGLVVSYLGGPRPYHTITGASAQDGRIIIYLSIAVPKAVRATATEVDYLLTQMRAGLEQDRPIWEHIQPDAGGLEISEKALRGFRAFCARFS